MDKYFQQSKPPNQRRVHRKRSPRQMPQSETEYPSKHLGAEPLWCVAFARGCHVLQTVNRRLDPRLCLALQTKLRLHTTGATHDRWQSAYRSSLSLGIRILG